MLRYTSSSFLRERKNVFVGLVNNGGLTDCVVTASSPPCWVSLRRFVSFNMIHQSNNGGHLKPAPGFCFCPHHHHHRRRGLYHTWTLHIGHRGGKGLRFQPRRCSWTTADALLGEKREASVRRGGGGGGEILGPVRLCRLSGLVEAYVSSSLLLLTGSS